MKAVGRRVFRNTLAGICLLAAGFASAGGGPLRVAATFYPMYVTVLNVVGDAPGVTVTCLTQPTVGCLHDYQLNTADLKTLAGTDILVANGAGMESFLDKVISQLPRLKIIEASAGAKLLPDGNPHLWVSITGAIAQTRHIADSLASLDPHRAAAYRKNSESYCAKLQLLHDETQSALKDVKNREIITFHEAFPYYADEFGLHIAGVVEREPGAEPNARELADTIKLIRSRGVRVVLTEPQYPPGSAEVIARETGVKVRTLDPVATGPLEPGKAKDYYLEAMRSNMTTLRNALIP